MRLTLKDYRKSLDEKFDKKFSDEDLLSLKNNIFFFMHERLVHLIVTLFTGCLLFASITIFIFTNYILFVLISLILIILFIFYIKHYYYLENEIQELYYIYNTKSTEIMENNRR